MSITIRGPARRRPLITLPDADAVDRRIQETEVELRRLHKLRAMVAVFDDSEPHASQATEAARG